MKKLILVQKRYDKCCLDWCIGFNLVFCLISLWLFMGLYYSFIPNTFKSYTETFALITTYFTMINLILSYLYPVKMYKLLEKDSRIKEP